MNEISTNLEQIDLATFAQNRNRFPQEALQRFAGKHVAFNRDGTSVVASGPDYETVFSELEKRGIHVSEVVFDYIPGLDEDTWL